nr:D-alanyl-D-alanine carboxypeptidase family protein [Paenibacillus abyssi]
MIAAGLPGITPYANAEPAKVYTNAYAAALIDVESGRILYTQRGDERTKIASLTKIMTAIVAIEQGKLSDIVKVSKQAAGKEGSSIYLEHNEEMSLHDMLYGLMLRSGNDAATAIAEHVGGSQQGFVHLMNEKAQWLGLDNTHFMNPHGLDHENHYSSANDLAKLTAYALKNETFRDIVKTKSKKVTNRDYSWINKNKMLSMYDGADGVKTGYTTQALRCLVSSATRGGQQLAAVTLNDRDDWVDHRKLLDWGFEHYPLQTVVKQDQVVSGYPLAVGRTFRYPFAEGEQAGLRTKLILADARTSSYALGERGGLELYLKETKIGTVPVYETAGQDAQSQSFRHNNQQPHKAAWSMNRSIQEKSSFASSLMKVVKSLLG